MSHITPEPMPVRTGDQRSIWQMVIEDMKGRDEFGYQKYGGPLVANDGRRSLVDAYQEALDLAVYLKKEIVERENMMVPQRISQRRQPFTEVTAGYFQSFVDCIPADVLSINADPLIAEYWVGGDTLIAWKRESCAYTGSSPEYFIATYAIETGPTPAA